MFGETDNKDSVLYYACDGESLRAEIVEWLLGFEAFADIINNDIGNGFTVLHKAEWWGNAELMDVLLLHGADPSIRNAFGWTPAEFGIWYSQEAHI